MYTYLILILIGLVAGYISGLIGIGGGVFIVPALVMLLGYSQKAAQGTSLGILLLPVGILAVYKYYQHGYVNPSSVLVMAGAFLVGSLLGSQLAMNWSDQLVKIGSSQVSHCGKTTTQGYNSGEWRNTGPIPK